MRTIKFRAWDNQNKKWVNSHELLKETFLDLEFTLVNDYFLDEFTREKNAWSIMQYTGLKDKNGKEIYEGDIVKDKYNKIGTVEFYTPYAGFISKRQLPDRTITIQLDQERNKFEIIGNIHEHGHLLK